MIDLIELNEYGLAVWKHKSRNRVFAHREYRWTNRILIINESSGNRTVEKDTDTDSIDFSNWVPLTKQEYELVKTHYSDAIWTNEDDVESKRQGWALFDTDSGLFELMALDDLEGVAEGFGFEYNEDNELESDEAALDYVRKHAKDNETCKKALKLLNLRKYKNSFTIYGKVQVNYSYDLHGLNGDCFTDDMADELDKHAKKEVKACLHKDASQGLLEYKLPTQESVYHLFGFWQI